MQMGLGRDKGETPRAHAVSGMTSAAVLAVHLRGRESLRQCSDVSAIERRFRALRRVEIGPLTAVLIAIDSLDRRSGHVSPVADALPLRSELR